MWLLFNNIHEKISRWLSRRNARVSRNQGKIAPWIAPSRGCTWFENNMMSPQKGPQSSSFNFCILQQNKSSTKFSWWYSVFTHRYGSLNLILIVSRLGKIIFYFIDQNQDHCKSSASQSRTSVPTLLLRRIPNERSHALIYEGDIWLRANKIAFFQWTPLCSGYLQDLDFVWFPKYCPR